MNNIILTSSFSTVAKTLLDKHYLPKESVHVAFIPTAGDPYSDTPWIEADRKALISLGYTVTDVDLKNKTIETLRQELSTTNIIFVAGGNTTYLCYHAHESGFDLLIPELLKSGQLYIGSSAGSILAGPSVEPFITEDLPELQPEFQLHNSKGLNLVDYIIFPHYPQSEEHNKKAREKFGNQFNCISLTDNEYRMESV